MILLAKKYGENVKTSKNHDLFDFFGNIINTSIELNKKHRSTQPKLKPGWRKCLELHESGWNLVGHSPFNNSDRIIITYWKKRAFGEMKQIIMNLNDLFVLSEYIEQRMEKHV